VSGFVLDAGGGGGDIAAAVRRLGHSVVCIDISAKAVKEARSKGLESCQGDLCALPYQENTFDFVLALDVLEHIEDDMVAIAETRRVLKKDGVLLANVPAFPCLWGSNDVANGHFRRYKRKELEKKLKSAEFKIIKRFYWNFILFLPALLLRRVKILLKISSDDVTVTKIDWLLKILLKADVWIAKRIPLPFGVSEMVVCQKC
jgi:SAM-dependent methyltransferase